jgi:hypothetical protein
MLHLFPSRAQIREDSLKKPPSSKMCSQFFLVKSWLRSQSAANASLQERQRVSHRVRVFCVILDVNRADLAVLRLNTTPFQYVAAAVPELRLLK